PIFGIEWDWTDIRITESTPTSGGVRFGKFTKSGQIFNGKLSLMIQDGQANLLAQPNVSVMDGEIADILIGDRLLYPKLVSYSDSGIPIYDTDEIRVGIYLQIASKVTEEDEIMLNLYPQVSLVTGYLKTQAGDYPQISTRQAKTTVAVKSGSTLAIGGLIREEELKNSTKVPFLGDIPVLGNLFKHSKTTKDRTELVIFLTPKIVSVSNEGESVEN
ncbi:MAG: type II and III secretion system protein, partial [Armatimonadota bacterium]